MSRQPGSFFLAAFQDSLNGKIANGCTLLIGFLRGHCDTMKNKPMKTLFTSEAVSVGARSGSITTPDNLLNIQLGNPLEPGKEKAGPNPEMLFAAAYSACFHGALMNAAKKL